MKNYRIIISLLLFFSFSSCDEVDEPFAGLVDSACDGVESPFFEGNEAITQDQENATRRVLIMDFTGHRCAGCPAAALEANTVATENEGEVFVLGIHPDIPSLTAPAESAEEPGDPFFTEWRTPEGNEYQSLYSIPNAIPLGVVSGTTVNGNYFTQWASWRTQVEDLILNSRPAEINLEIEYTESSRGVRIEGDVAFLDDFSDSHSLILAVVENNIVDWQKNGTSEMAADPAFPPGDIPDYIHKHILRAHVNGLGGTQLNTEEISQGDIYSFCEAGTIAEEFDINEVSIMAILYNNTTLEVQDVLERKVIE